MIRQWKMGLRAATVAFMLAALAAGPVRAAEDIPWPESEMFNKTTFEEDVKNVLRSILRQAGTQAVFRPGVEGLITAEFANMPLQAAFNKLMIERNLAHEFDPETNLVTIYPQGSREVVEDLIPIVHSSARAIRSAADRLGLGGRVTVDADTGLALIKGSPDEVKKLKQLVERLETASRERTAVASSSRDAAVAEHQAVSAMHQAEAARQTAEMQRRMLDDYMNQQIEVVPLKYASVGATTKSFMGQTVTVPGIDETLRTLMGNDKTQESGEMAKLLPAEMRLNRPAISIDQRSNSVVIRGTPTAIGQVRDIIRMLDRPLPMVDIEVLVVEASDTATAELGVNWGYFRQNQTNGSSLQGAVASNANNLLNAVTLKTTTGPTSGVLANFLYQGTSAALGVQLQALSSRGEAQVLSSPHVVTLNGVPAQVTQSQEVFIPIDTGLPGGAAGTLESINAGLTLNITPSVLPYEETGDKPLVRLTVNAEKTSLGTPVSGNVSTSGTQVTTDVMVPEGSTFIMAGMVDDTRRETRGGIPLLKDIPILGALFRVDSSQDTLSEVLYFITPRIVTQADLYAEDIAARRYLNKQKGRLASMRQKLQTESYLLPDNVLHIEEDE